MDQGLLPRRYAKALYKYAVERDVAAQMYTVMDTLTKAYDDNASLQATIANPFVDNARKASILATAADAKNQGKAAEAFDDFINLLGRHRRMDIMRETALAYLAIYRREHNIYKVHITSAATLADSDRNRINAMVEKHLQGGTAQYTYSTDPALIGGFTVTIDSQRLDASVRNELQQLRQRLIQ